MKHVDRVVTIAARTLGFVAGLAVVGLMLHICTDVVMRAFFDSPLPGTLELVQYWWMITIAFGAWGLAQLRNEHIEAPLLYERLPVTYQRLWQLVGDLVAVAFLVVVAYYSWPVAREAQAMGEIAGAHETPIWPTRYWVPVAAALLAAMFALRFVKGLVGERPEPADAAQEISPAL